MCSKQYTDCGSLWQHKTSAQERVKYPCDQCNSRLFTMAAKLRRHKASAHEGVRYSCDQCDMSVKQVSFDNTKHQCMKEIVINVTHVIIKQLEKGICRDPQYLT